MDQWYLWHHDATFTDIIANVKEDINCDWRTPLVWIVYAKNCLINVSACNPHKVVLGWNINLTSIYNDKPSAYLPQNPLVIEHLSAAHATWQAFTTTGHKKKLKLPFVDKYVTPETNLKMVQKFYYKRNNNIKCKEPGKVVGQDGAIIFIRHGGICLWVQWSHEFNYLKTNQEKSNITESENEQKNPIITQDARNYNESDSFSLLLWSPETG